MVWLSFFVSKKHLSFPSRFFISIAKSRLKEFAEGQWKIFYSFYSIAILDLRRNKVLKLNEANKKLLPMLPVYTVFPSWTFQTTKRWKNKSFNPDTCATLRALDASPKMKKLADYFFPSDVPLPMSFRKVRTRLNSYGYEGHTLAVWKRSSGKNSPKIFHRRPRSNAISGLKLI